MKRIFAVMLCIVLLGSMMSCLTGCNNEPVSTEDRHIVMVYFYGQNLPKDIDLVEAAINERLKELGTDITMEYYPMSVYNQTYTTSLMTDPIDLMLLAFGNNAQFYADLDMIQTLTMEDMEQYCPGIVEMNKEYEMFIRSYDGEILGTTIRPAGGCSSGCYLIRQSDLEAIGLAEKYTNDSMVTLADLEEIFTKLKEKFPDAYPIGTQMDESYYYVANDPLSGGMKRASGVLDFTDNGFDSTKVVNYYETDAYVEYCKFMAKCKDNGWLDPESETSTTGKNAAFFNGLCRGVFLDGTPAMNSIWSNDCGEPCVTLQIVEQYMVPARNDALTWAVSGTSDKKAATLEFLNLFMTDVKLMNLVQWGIEGTHFEIINEEYGIIDFAEGLDAQTSGYYMGGGFYGDQRYIYAYKSSTQTLEEQIQTKKDDLAFGKRGEANPSPAGSFVFNASEHSITIKNIEAVIDRYANIMALGGYTDEVYARFIAEMKEAGVDTVIADKQTQLDAYLAEQN